MKRHFEVIGERLTMELDVTKEGMKLTVDEIEKHFKTKLREIGKDEYKILTKEYQS